MSTPTAFRGHTTDRATHRTRTAARRLTTLTAAALSAAAALTGCGPATTEQTTPEAPTTQDTADASQATADASTFPVTVEHAFGETTIDYAPERVVTLGWGDVDNVLALGITPVGYTSTHGAPGLQPWSEEITGDDDAVDLGPSLDGDFEEIAALEPDLIIEVQHQTDEQRFERLSSIAPTVTRPEGSDPWRVNRAEGTRQIAHALGQQEAGEQLLNELDQHIADTRNEHPQLQDKVGTAVLVSDETTYWGFHPRDSRGQFVETIGMQTPQGVLELINDDQFSVEVSAEEVEVFDGDLIMFLTEDVNFVPEEYNQLFADFDAAMVVPTADERWAISTGTPLATHYALDHLVPLIAEALED
ncbi:iron-siderophore ABC transporter substrate-binding protein [Nesterenkonia suensis]